MQLEDLQRQWQLLDDKLNQNLLINTEILRRAVVKPVKGRMYRTSIWPIIDIAFCFVVIGMAVSLLANHWQSLSLVIPCLGVMFGGILLLATSVHQLVVVSNMDWSAPVAEIQKSLAGLQMIKIRQFKWIILLSPLVGFCALIMCLQMLLDMFAPQQLILAKLDSAWVISNYVFGLLFIPLGQIVVRFFADRFGNRGWWQRAVADLSGTSMRKSQEELSRWNDLSSQLSIAQ